MTETSFTLRTPPYTYYHLQVVSFRTHTAYVPDSSLDPITLLTHLTSAFSQYLGLTGSAIPIDTLKVQGSQGWIRTPRQDEPAVIAALSQWTGKGGVSIRVLGRSTWLGGLMKDDGVDDAKLWSLDS